MSLFYLNEHTSCYNYSNFIEEGFRYYKFDKGISKQIFDFFKWNCIERIVSKVDKFVFNILVSRIGEMEYAVHVIVIQIRDVSQAFIQGFSDGITISIGIESGNNNKERMNKYIFCCCSNSYNYYCHYYCKHII